MSEPVCSFCGGHRLQVGLRYSDYVADYQGMEPYPPLDHPKGNAARPLWKRRVPTPVFLGVIVAGILAFSALWLPAHRGMSKADCDRLWPGHVWYNGKCNVQVGNPNSFYVPDGGP